MYLRRCPSYFNGTDILEFRILTFQKHLQKCVDNPNPKSLRRVRHLPISFSIYNCHVDAFDSSLCSSHTYNMQITINQSVSRPCLVRVRSAARPKSSGTWARRPRHAPCAERCRTWTRRSTRCAASSYSSRSRTRLRCTSAAPPLLLLCSLHTRPGSQIELMFSLIHSYYSYFTVLCHCASRPDLLSGFWVLLAPTSICSAFFLLVYGVLRLLVIVSLLFIQ